MKPSKPTQLSYDLEKYTLEYMKKNKKIIPFIMCITIDEKETDRAYILNKTLLKKRYKSNNYIITPKSMIKIIQYALQEIINELNEHSKELKNK